MDRQLMSKENLNDVSEKGEIRIGVSFVRCLRVYLNLREWGINIIHFTPKIIFLQNRLVDYSNLGQIFKQNKTKIEFCSQN